MQELILLSRALIINKSQANRAMLLIAFLFLWLYQTISFSAASAQESSIWASFERVQDYQDNTFPPRLVADLNRTVHAFTTQQLGENPFQRAIIYRQWSLEGGWTEPVDIIMPDAGEVNLLDIYLDKDGRIHLIYQGTDLGLINVYYSWAPAISAGQAASWSKPVALGRSAILPSSGSISGDGHGNVTIIYSGNRDGNGVYSLHSTDAGSGWSEPESMFLTFDQNQLPYSLQLTMGQENQLHGVWNVVGSTGVDKSLYYSRQDLTSLDWGQPILLDTRIDEEGFFGPSFPEVVNSGEMLVIMTNGGSQARAGTVDVGRPVQRVHLSTDNGDSWSAASEPFPELQGRSGSHALVVDSAGTVHALFIQRNDRTIDGRWEPIGGMWHSQLQGQIWTEPVRVVMGRAGHDLSAVISQGNTLLVTMREDPGTGESGIFYSFTSLNAPDLPLTSLPTVSTLSGGPSTTSPQPTEVSMNNPAPAGASDLTNDVPVSTSHFSDMIVLAVAPALVVIAVVVVAHRIISRRNT